MALHSAPEKLIFAPGDGTGPGQAGQFTLGKLHKNDLDVSPIAQFNNWFAQAQAVGVPVTGGTGHPEACVLSTAALPSGRVSSRVVYLKELDVDGRFVIYSNFGTSRKAADIASNPNVSIVFWWEALQRQVRIEGQASRISSEEGQIYFDTRARGSRIGAWSSRQSQVLQPDPTDPEDDGRKQLDGWVAETESRFKDQEKVPIPEFWGGLRIVPDHIEFWQGRESRLHDRFVYDKKEDGEWALERLSP